MTTINGHEIKGRITLIPDLRQATREGRKTRTSRPMKPQPDGANRIPWPGRKGIVMNVGDERISQLAPYQPGDVIAMCEPIKRIHGHGDFADYAAYADDSERVYYPLPWGQGLLPWRWKVKTLSSRYMPTEAARTLLRITAVGAGRIQAITPGEAWAEGARCSCMSPVMACKGNIDAFAELWDSIYGAGAWERNDHIFWYEWEVV
jgi:hypothetical protein